MLALALVAGVAACSDDGTADSDSTTTAADRADATTTTVAETPAEPILFGAQGNHLEAYATEPDASGAFEDQRVITGHDAVPEESSDPDGTDINAQICFFPDGSGRFIAGEDTNQPNPPAGWGIFQLTGGEVGDLSAEQVGKLTPTYQAGEDGPENYGCGFLEDGRVLTTDVGDQAAGDGNGQLIVWFPPFDSYEVAYCKIDVGLATGQSIYVMPGDKVLVAASRGGVFAYTGPFPTGPDAAGGCGKQDATGAPMVDTVNKTTFIAQGDHELGTPAGIATAPDGGVYVSSVFNRISNQYSSSGVFVRPILRPPAGESIGPKPYSTGTPLGMVSGPDGTLYYADIGIVAEPGKLPGPGSGTGTVRRIVFESGEPLAPEIMASGLAFPDGMGILVPD